MRKQVGVVGLLDRAVGVVVVLLRPVCARFVRSSRSRIIVVLTFDEGQFVLSQMSMFDYHCCFCV